MKSLTTALLIFTTLLNPLYTSLAEPYIWTTIAGTNGVYGNKDGLGKDALFHGPAGIVSDGKGHLMVADMFNNSVRELTRGGTNWVVSTIATNTTRSQSVAIDPQGNLYVTGLETYQVWRLSPAGSNYSSQVIFGTFSCPGTSWIAVDAETNMYVTCSLGAFVEGIASTSSNLVGSVIAGKPGSTFDSVDGINDEARFGDVEGIARDPAGNLYVGETWSETVREISPHGTDWVVATIAGTAHVVGSLDGSDGDAQFTAPTGIALDSAGNLFVTDWGFGSVRKIRHQGTNWVVTTVAGPNDGNFKQPMGITVDPDGTLYVTDYAQHIIRQGIPFVPILQCTRVGQQVQLSWSQVATKYVLESSTSLGPNTSWTAVPDSPIAIGSNFQLTYPISDPTRFYRLRE